MSWTFTHGETWKNPAEQKQTTTSSLPHTHFPFSTIVTSPSMNYLVYNKLNHRHHHTCQWILLFIVAILLRAPFLSGYVVIFTWTCVFFKVKKHLSCYFPLIFASSPFYPSWKWLTRRNFVERRVVKKFFIFSTSTQLFNFTFSSICYFRLPPTYHIWFCSHKYIKKGLLFLFSLCLSMYLLLLFVLSSIKLFLLFIYTH